MATLYSISEFADKIGVNEATLRNWHKGGSLMPAHISPGGHRYYSQEQFLEITNQSKYVADGMDSISGVVLITGATGSLGHELITEIAPVAKKVIVYSRDELKQAHMKHKFSQFQNIRYFVGDIRDKNRLNTAFRGVDTVIHAAALKRVETCTYNPTEGVNTNINGTINVAEACIENEVKRALFVSSDKAAQPILPYGYMKAMAESCWINFNNYSGGRTAFMATRYGNIINSNGSFYHMITEQKKSGKIKITDPNMSRFYMTLKDAVDLNLFALANSISGEIFIPKIKSASLMTFVEAFGENYPVETIGMRGVEKLAECLIAEHEMSHTFECGDYFKILPPHISEPGMGWDGPRPKEKPIKTFKYTSDSNDVDKLTVEDLKNMISNGT